MEKKFKKIMQKKGVETKRDQGEESRIKRKKRGKKEEKEGGKREKVGKWEKMMIILATQSPHHHFQTSRL